MQFETQISMRRLEQPNYDCTGRRAWLVDFSKIG